MTATGYQFGAFRFDRVAYQVARGSETLNLTPKLLDLLLYLLERPATLVTKEELLRSVWERRGELALLRALGYRRAALGRLVFAENVFLLCAGLLIGEALASPASGCDA